MADVIDPTARTRRESIRHARLIEQGVNKWAPRVWQATIRDLHRWLTSTLRAIEPAVERLIIEERRRPDVRANNDDPEVLYLAGLIESLQRAESPDGFPRITQAFADQVATQYGFLAEDPRRDSIINYSERILLDDLSSYWQSLTEPQRLARQLVTLREQGLSYTRMSEIIGQRYSTAFYRAERLVRSAYNSSANNAAVTELQEAGVETKRWITARDGRVRGGGDDDFNHRRMDGQRVPIDQPFVTPEGYRLMFPGDRSLGAPAGTIVNCRCAVIEA